jgi:hypothetical protein
VIASTEQLMLGAILLCELNLEQIKVDQIADVLTIEGSSVILNDLAIELKHLLAIAGDLTLCRLKGRKVLCNWYVID